MMTPAKWHHHHAMRGPSSVPLLLALALVLPSLALALPLPRSPSSSTSTTASASASRSAGRDGARHDRARLRLPLQGVTRRRRGLPRGHGRPRGFAAPVGGGPAVSDMHVIACVARSLAWAT